MIRGQPKFDGIAIGEFTAIFLGPTLEFTAKAAFTNSKTGETHGWTKHTHWSKNTIAKLQELRAAMEMDLGQEHFEGGGEVLVGPSGATTPRGLAPDGGLGEHLGDEKVPSI